MERDLTSLNLTYFSLNARVLPMRRPRLLAGDWPTAESASPTIPDASTTAATLCVRTLLSERNYVT